MVIDRLSVQKTTKIAVFLGAGASAPFDYPTTKTFFERLGRKLGPQDQQLWSYFNSLKNLHSVNDIENVVEILDSILQLDKDSKLHPVTEFFSKYPMHVDFGKRTDKTTYTPVLENQQNWKELVELSRRLRDKVEEFVFEQYESDRGKLPAIKNVIGTFFSVLGRHCSEKDEYEVFTTNYDNVIEDYCSEAGYTCSLTGVDIKQEPKYDGLSIGNFVLTKLHGALNWLVDKQTKEINVIGAQTLVRSGSKSWERNEYVLFGTKARLNEENLYYKLLSRLEKRLMELGTCVVVGFQFRDVDINKIFRRALERNKTLKIIIISNAPAKSLKNLVPERRELRILEKEKRVIKLKCKFGTNKVASALETALTSR